MKVVLQPDQPHITLMAPVLGFDRGRALGIRPPWHPPGKLSTCGLLLSDWQRLMTIVLSQDITICRVVNCPKISKRYCNAEECQYQNMLVQWHNTTGPISPYHYR